MQQRQARPLESYLSGHWQRGKATNQPFLVKDAATSAPVALVDASGLAMGEAMDYGRRQGGKALRALTLHERAAMLKALGLYLLERKERYYEQSFHTGATRADSWVDIEGGIGTLLQLASRARRDLPNSDLWLEGETIALAKDDSFAAEHILTPLRGIVLHINAFNFPIWGLLEKFAPSFLAGMPCLAKPATQTAYLTELLVKDIIASGLLPEGSLQLVCGSLGDGFDYLEGQDVVTFTGSAATAHLLRCHPAIIKNSVRFNAEADSLNACILAPDASEDSPEFALFVKEIVREMTGKAGQKCTAIRRIIVPKSLETALSAAISQRLAGIEVGLPWDANTRMGPLVGLDQRQDVKAALSQLTSEASVIYGDYDNPKLSSGAKGEGAFVSPMLLAAGKGASNSSSAVHNIEAFGPIATLIAYQDWEEALALASYGKGSLVSSVFTNDPSLAKQAVLGLASYHGRVMIGNRDSAKSSTGHGSPLAMLVHGGPGRAGGGEELGGIRALKHYCQRTSIQGAPRLLAAISQRWLAGANVRQEGHPFRRDLTQLQIGDQFQSPSRIITKEDVEHFAHFTGDIFYAHMDEAAAKANPFFNDRVAHGYMVVSFAAGLFVDPAPGPVLANYGIDNLRFLTPVYFGDNLQVCLTCKEINRRQNSDYGEVRWDCRITNQNAALVAQYDVLTMVAKSSGIPTNS